MNELLNLIEQQAEIKRYFKLCNFKKNEVICYESSRCESFGVVKKGEIVIVSFYEDGSEVIYNKIIRGMSFGGNLIFSSEPFYRGDVISKEESEVYLISKENLIKTLMSNERFMLAYLNMQSDFTKHLNFKIKLLTFNNAKDRFMYYLNFHNGVIYYETITELANELNLTRESLSRLIHKLIKDEVIIRSKKYIKIKNSR